MSTKQSVTFNDAEGPVTLVFSEASPQQRIQCYKLASTAFGRSLSEAEYLDREEFFKQLPVARGSNWRFWCVTTTDGPDDIFAMCKTMHRDLLIRDVAGTRKAQGYCIGSVVTDSRYRGRGLASILLKRVAEWMDDAGQATASMLYSDIGGFYVSKGWDVQDAFQSTLKVTSSTPWQQDGLPETRSLTRDDLPAICERDVVDVRNELDQTDLPSGQTIMNLPPTSDLIGWLQDRAEYMSLKTSGKRPEARGSICESMGLWMYWCHDIRHKQLIVQRVKITKHKAQVKEMDEALAKLLLDAIDEARSWTLNEVVIWSPPDELQRAMRLLTVETGLEVVSDKREHDEIPCIRWRGAEKRAVVLWPNEYYAWG